MTWVLCCGLAMSVLCEIAIVGEVLLVTFMTIFRYEQHM